jgi:uncharacterized membrane protein YphA (DoxX/SURF4 family)
MTTVLKPPTETAAETSARGESFPAVLLEAVVALKDFVLDLLRPLAVPALRIALGVVYIWFGILKIVGLSPVADMVASMLPFLPAQVAVVSLGVVEVLLGAALVLRLLVPWIAAVQVVHLLGTFAVFLFRPDLTFVDGNLLAVSLEGEFIAKNLVLVAALVVVAAHTPPRRARSGD